MIFEELDSVETGIGTLSLRRRTELRLGDTIVYEVKLGEEFLMSSLFTDAEVQLARQGLELLKQNFGDQPLEIVVGGLGLGYTAAAVLDDEIVAKLEVIELMPAVIRWHRDALLPVGDRLAADSRCALRQGDFFALATATPAGSEPSLLSPVHGIFLDIDHSPTNWLDASNSSFYTEESLRRLANHLHRGGVFGLWSDDAPDPVFAERLRSAFGNVESRVVSFPNPLTGGESTNTLYFSAR